MIKTGNIIEVKGSEGTFQGILMPGSSEKKIILKQKSGYNIVVSNVKSTKLLKKIEEKKIIQKKIKPNKALKNITLLHFGGTLASKVDYETGAVSASFKPEEILSMFPEIRKIANIKSRLITNALSENLTFMHYNLLAKEIAKEKDVDGIIITHGTDTLHYTSAALSFILEDINIPVILVGSQRSSDRGSSDAFLNLISAFQFIVNTDFVGVAICMHEWMSDTNCVVMPACKTRKLHTSRRDAFKVINDDPIARIAQGNIKYFNNHYPKKGNKTLNLKLFKDNKIGILRAHPNLKVEELKIYEKFDGLIIEGTGLGHMPMLAFDELSKENEKIYLELKKLCKKIPVVMTSQCIFGRINMNVYKPGRLLQDIGVIGNNLDMLPEVAFIKLAWLLSNYPNKVRDMMPQNLRGEINELTTVEFL